MAGGIITPESQHTGGEGAAPDVEMTENGRMAGPATRTDKVGVVDGATDDLTTLIGDDNVTFNEAMAALDGQGRREEDDASEDREHSGEDGIADPDDADEIGNVETVSEASDSAEDAGSDEDSNETAADEDDTDGDVDVDPVDSFIEQVNETFPDVEAESPDDVMAELERERRSNDVIVDVLDAHPSLLGFFEDVVRAQTQHDGAVNVDALAAEHFQTAMDLPDPEEDPEGYRDALKEQARREAQRETTQAQRERQLREAQDQLRTMRENAQKSVKKAAKEFDLEGDALTSFQESLADFVNRPDENFARIVYLGMNHGDLVEAAKEDAYKRGKNDAVTERKQRREKSKSIKKLSSSRTTTSEETSDADEDLVGFAKSLQRQSDPLGDLMG
jgi:hypothetical protein